MHNRFKRLLVPLLSTGLLALFCTGAAAEKKIKVLYFTHEPGKWHKYTPQLKIFKEVGEKAGWDVTVWTGEHEAQIKKLETPDYGKDYDVIVYNFCFAASQNLKAASNLMAQTREHGVPAVLIHCAMHSWWATYKNGKEGALGPDYKGMAKAVPKLADYWKKENPDKPFPAWGDFTGIASTRHGPKQPIVVKKTQDHPITARYPDGFKTGNTELYNNVYKVKDVVSLLDGTQGKATASVLWLCPQGKSKVLGFSLGHDLGDWQAESFKNILVDGVKYLSENPGN